MDLVRTLLDRFLAGTPERISEMRRAHADGNLAEIALLAHSLRSTAGHLGAGDVTRRAAEVERAARDERLERLAESIQSLEAAFADSCLEIRDRREQLG